LPFEASFYEQAGVPVCFVGHPLQHEVKSKFSRDEALAEFGFDPRRKTLGLLPGSRRSEIKRLLPVLLNAAEKIYLEEPEIQYLLPLAATLEEADLAPYLQGHKLPIKVISNRAYDVMAACDVMIAASGTVTLEAALMGVPIVVIYKMKLFSYWIGRLLIKVNHIALCNIIAGEGVVPELIQQAVSPERVARKALRLLRDKEQARVMRQKLCTIRDKLGTGAQCTIAELTLAMLKIKELGQQPDILKSY
jgi:lipid-A-disaccharide synthase